MNMMQSPFEQFVKERKYLKNVTPRTEAWYWQSWNALACKLVDGSTAQDLPGCILAMTAMQV
jgi:hypothetical protein